MPHISKKGIDFDSSKGQADDAMASLARNSAFPLCLDGERWLIGLGCMYALGFRLVSGKKLGDSVGVADCSAMDPIAIAEQSFTKT